MDRIEETVILECLRETRRQIGLTTAKLTAEHLRSIDPRITIDSAIACVERKPINGPARKQIASAALQLLASHPEALLAEEIGDGTKAFLAQIFRDYRGIDLGIDATESAHVLGQTAGGPMQSAEKIFRNWRTASKKGGVILRSGIYQMLRRYKPTRRMAQNPGYDWLDSNNHAVVHELISVDSDNMECILVTSELNIYYGTMFINHEDILFGLLQRKTSSGGLNQRFIALKLERRRMPMYSGLCIKVGDTTTRPLASECLYVHVLPSHSDLYEEFRAIRRDIWTKARLEKEAIAARYVTSNPPMTPYDPQQPSPDWERVKFVREIPELIDLVREIDGVTLFREPLRTLSVETLAELAYRLILPVFQHKKRGAAEAATVAKKLGPEQRETATSAC